MCRQESRTVSFISAFQRDRSPRPNLRTGRPGQLPGEQACDETRCSPARGFAYLARTKTDASQPHTATHSRLWSTTIDSHVRYETMLDRPKGAPNVGAGRWQAAIQTPVSWPHAG